MAQVEQPTNQPPRTTMYALLLTTHSMRDESSALTVETRGCDKLSLQAGHSWLLDSMQFLVAVAKLEKPCLGSARGDPGGNWPGASVECGRI